MNLATGGTNGLVVEQLLDASTKLGKVGRKLVLRQCDKLHAKVWIGDECALVSSANVSVFGLSFGEINPRTWNEAGLLVNDPKTVADIRVWFDNLWTDPSLDEILIST
jgi:phosphatidylserine/phosphatidylglycerophosphate/cardiolipin synthase-like enzyme